MLLDILDMVLGVAASLLGSALLLRAYLAWLRIARTNPVGVFCLALTDWLVIPLRRLVPLRGRLDAASLAGALVVALAFVSIMQALRAHGAVDWLLLPAASLLLLHWALYLLVALVIFNALFTMVNPHAPLAPIFDALTRPLLGPIRRRLPLVGGFDLSPLVLIVMAEIALYVLAHIAL